jgi:transposase InsO family protein
MEGEDMAQRKAKQSRARTLARRRRKDLYDAQRAKHNGPWKRKDRRRAAFQTMKERFGIVQHYRRLCRSGMPKGEAAQQTAEAFGISASTVRNYERLVRQHGKRGLMPEIRVRATPPRTPWDVIQIILMLRGRLGWGGDRIAAELKSRTMYTISGQGVYNLFKRYRVSTRTYHPVGKRRGIAYQQLTATRTNETWHLDFAGPFENEKQEKVWVLLVVDAYSRLLLTLKVVESLETQMVMEHLTDLFAQYGKPDRVVTDNAPTFRSMWEADRHRFSEWLEKDQGIAHQRIAPYYPESNGKAEAAVKITKHEAIVPFLERLTWTGKELQRCLDRFQAYYNFDRLHGGIGWKTPAECYTGKAERPQQLERLFFMKEPHFEFQFC